MQRLPFQALSCSLEDRKAVTSKSRLRYKLRFHHISRFDLNYKYLVQKIAIWFETNDWGQAAVGAKLQATNRVPRPVDRGTATRYGG